MWLRNSLFLKNFILLFCLVAFAGWTNAQTTTWTGNTDSNWDTPGNWSSGVPTSSDDVSIPITSNDPIISSSAEAKSINIQSSATLTVGVMGDLEVNGGSSYGINISGTLENSGIIQIGNISSPGNTGISFSGTITNNDGAEITIDRSVFTGLSGYSNGSVTNDGTIQIGGSSSVGSTGILIQTGATITNNSTISINNCTSIGFNFGIVATLTNAGLIKLGELGSVGSTAINCFGTLVNSGCSSVINVFSNSRIVYGSGGTITNNGNIIDRASAGSSVTTNNGFIQNLNGGIFFVGSGNPAITTSGTFWNGCSGTDWTNPQNWASGIVPSSLDMIVIPNVTNDPIISSNVQVASIHVQTGGVLNITSGFDLMIDFSPQNSIQNDGSITNYGLISIGSSGLGGTYGFVNGSTGIFNNESGAELKINNCTSGGFSNTNGTVNNSGTINLGDLGSNGFEGLSNEGSFTNLTGSEINIDQSQFQFYHGSGTFSNSGTIHIGSVYYVGANGLQAYSTFTNTSSGMINVETSDGPAIFVDQSVIFTNNGTISIADGNTVYNEGINCFMATFTNTGTIEMGMNGGLVDFNAIYLESSSLNNTGTIHIGNISDDILTGTSSTFNLNTGGELGGTGTIVSSILNIAGGTIAPGNSPGIMTFDNSTNFSNSTLDIEIDGTGTPGTQFDQVVVNGTATLGGTLAATVNFSPIAGDQVTIIEATTLSGTFSSVTGLTGWFVNYDRPSPGQVTLSFGSPLPVELLDFTAEKREKGIQLRWTTASELNNKGFWIEKSKDGQSWNYLTFLEGKTNSQTLSYYQYQDLNPYAGNNYYRLRQEDLDGTSSLSKIVNLYFEGKESPLSAFPNPTTGLLTIEAGGADQVETFEILDPLGRRLYTGTINEETQKLQVDLSAFSKGIYFLKYKQGGETFTDKIQLK